MLHYSLILTDTFADIFEEKKYYTLMIINCLTIKRKKSCFVFNVKKQPPVKAVP